MVVSASAPGPINTNIALSTFTVSSIIHSLPLVWRLPLCSGVPAEGRRSISATEDGRWAWGPQWNYNFKTIGSSTSTSRWGQDPHPPTSLHVPAQKALLVQRYIQASPTAHIQTHSDTQRCTVNIRNRATNPEQFIQSTESQTTISPPEST